MTNLQKILEVGIACPCGGTVDIRGWAIGNGLTAHEIRCSSCGSSIYGPTALEALTMYYVRTGGPVRGMIQPPTRTAREIIYGNSVESSLSPWVRREADLITSWWFRVVERIPYVIKTWLEKEWTP